MTLHLQHGDRCWTRLWLTLLVLLSGCIGFAAICLGVYVIVESSSSTSSLMYLWFGLYVFVVLTLCHALQVVLEHVLDYHSSVDDIEDFKRHDISQPRLFFEAVTGIEGWSGINECFDVPQWLQRYPVRCALYSTYFSLVFYFLYVMVWIQASIPWYSSYVVIPYSLTEFCEIFNTIFTLAAEIFFIVTDLGFVQDALFYIEAYTPIVIWRMRIRLFLANEYPLVQQVCGGNHSEDSVSSIYTAQAVIVIWAALVSMLPFLAFRSSRFVFDTRIYWISSLVCIVLTYVAMMYTADLGNEVVGTILEYASPNVTVSTQPSTTADTIKSVANVVVGLLNDIDTIKGCTISDFEFYAGNASATPTTISGQTEGYYRAMYSQGTQGQTLLWVIAAIAFLLCLPTFDVDSRDPILFHESADLYLSMYKEDDFESTSPPLLLRLWHSLKRVILSEVFVLTILIGLMALAVGSKGIPVSQVSLSRISPTAVYPWPCYANYNELEAAFLNATSIEQLLVNVVNAVIDMNLQAGDLLDGLLDDVACISTAQATEVANDIANAAESGVNWIGGEIGSLNVKPRMKLKSMQHPLRKHATTNTTAPRSRRRKSRMRSQSFIPDKLCLGNLLSVTNTAVADVLEDVLDDIIEFVYPLIDDAVQGLLSDIDSIVVAVFDFLASDLINVWEGFQEIENILDLIPTIVKDVAPYLPFLFVVFQCCVALVASLVPAVGTMCFLAVLVTETQVLVVIVVAYVVLDQLLTYYGFQLLWSYSPSILLLDAGCIVGTVYLSFLLYLQQIDETPYIPYVLKAQEAKLEKKLKQPKPLEMMSPSPSSDEDASLLTKQTQSSTVQGIAMRRLRTTLEVNAAYSLKPNRKQSKKKF